MADITGCLRHRPDLPLHAEPVTALNTTALTRMAPTSQSLTRALRWLSDADLYKLIAQRSTPHRTKARPASITAADEEMMRTLGRYAVIEDLHIQGLANVFTVVELQKGRRRHILEPLFNDLMRPDDFDSIALPTFSSIRCNLKKYAVQFDASAFYDQFRLAPGVSRFFAFRLLASFSKVFRKPKNEKFSPYHPHMSLGSLCIHHLD
jgi:hypothetical protein